MVGNDAAPHQRTMPLQIYSWWQQEGRFETVMEDAGEEECTSVFDSMTNSSGTESMENGSDEELVISRQSWTTATPDQVKVVNSEEKHRQQKQRRAVRDLTTTPSKAVDAKHLLAENMLLKRQLSEALELRVPSAEANAAASEAVADELRAKNRKLSAMLMKSREEIAALHERQSKMEHVMEENAALQRSIEETRCYTMLLVNDIQNLKTQLSEERQKRAASEAQQDVRKKLCHKLFMAMQDVRLAESPLAAAEQKGVHFNTRNITASETPVAETSKDVLAHGHGPKDSWFHPSAEGGLQLPAHRLDGKPRITSPGGSSAQSQTGCPQTTIHSFLSQRSASERNFGPQAFTDEGQVAVPITFGRGAVP